MFELQPHQEVGSKRQADGPKDHIQMRMLHSGFKTVDKRGFQNVCIIYIYIYTYIYMYIIYIYRGIDLYLYIHIFLPYHVI